MPVEPVCRDLADLPEEAWGAPDRGDIGWKTLFSGGLTPTEALTCGVAILPAGGRFAAHRHAAPEVYFGIEGRATVTIEGAPFEIAPGVALFIPGGAVHGVTGGEAPARWFYAFATDSFADVVYDFGDGAAP